MIVRLPHRFIARSYQREILDAVFNQSYRHIYFVAHRRSGKDKLCINLLTIAACRRVGTYLYLFPQHNQARKVIWKGIDGNGMRFLDHIPKELIAKSNSTEMYVELINGSVIQLGGSNKFDALMGTNPVGIVYSEFPLHNPMARQYLNPILAENGGFEVLQGTPRGRNHAYNVWQSTFYDKKWFVKSLGVDDTKKEDGSPVVSQEEIDDFRRSGMSEELIRQEFYVDWNIGITGAYYTEEMDKVEKEGRLGVFPISQKTPVWTFWDIGISDATAIWFMQPEGSLLNCIYYYENSGKGIEHYIQVLNEVRDKLGIQYHAHYAPHDIAQREWTSARSRVAIAQGMGLHFQIVKRASIEDGIQAVKSLFPRMRFHVEHCQKGIVCLREYRREYDEANRVYKVRPLHNWASNGADAMRYMALVWQDLFTNPHANQPVTYRNTLLY